MCARFWESVQQMKKLPQSEVRDAVNNIWKEFLSPDALCPVNVDSKSVELAREAVHATTGPNRWCFDVAAAHVYHLMKSDSYSRYLRSDMYKEYLNGSKKKVKSIPNLFGVKRWMALSFDGQQHSNVANKQREDIFLNAPMVNVSSAAQNTNTHKKQPESRVNYCVRVYVCIFIVSACKCIWGQ